MGKLPKVTVKEMKTLLDQAEDLQNAIRKNIGSTFSVYTLRDALSCSHEDAVETINFLDSMGYIKKVEKKFQILVGDKEKSSYLKERISFLSSEVERFNTSIEYFNLLQKVRDNG